MRRYLKSELAQAAGVSSRTLQRWMASNSTRLSELGWTRQQKYLSPRVTRFICYEYGIDLEDLPDCA